MARRLFFLICLMPCAGIAQQADSVLALKHLQNIINTEKPRNYQQLDALNQVAEYIHSVFSEYADSVSYQPYKVGKKEFKNVIGSFGTENKKRIIIGAHYDVCGYQDGADDNASGVVGLLELARLLKDEKLNYRIDLVGYTLEEPPFFRSKNMGSYIHAKSLSDSGAEVEGMVCLEMIGYFDEAKKSQRYPVGALRVVYGSRGNFITVVRKTSAGAFARRFSNTMKKGRYISTKSFQGPEKLAGIDFSDHLNYWKFDYSAVMITNTAFYRNQNYHKKSDKIGTLNIGKMTAVIQQIYTALHTINLQAANVK